MSPQEVAQLIQKKLTPGLVVYLQPVWLLFLAGVFLKWSVSADFALKMLLVAFGVVSLGISLFLVVWVLLMHRWSREILPLMREGAHQTVIERYSRFAFSRREKEHYLKKQG